jgi:putative ABC transport system ATP-binding protein
VEGSLLRLEGVTKRFRRGSADVTALAAVDLDLHGGEFVSLIGPSGSGKSTLLHLAAGLDRPEGGRVLFDGRDLAEMSVGERALLRRRHIGFVFQFFHLIATLTVAENVELPLILDGSRRNGRPLELLERVGLAGRAHHFPSELSGGEMQRAAIARAVVARPRLLLADEPTGNLDSVTGEEILNLLSAEVAETGTTLLMVTHDTGAASRADRVLSLRDGKLT